MLFSYIKIAVRQLLRNRVYSAINIIGFALGLLVWLVISLYVIDDLSYDHMHSKGDRIYRLITHDRTLDTTGDYAVTSGRLALTIREEIPEVESSVRMFNFGNAPLRRLDMETSSPNSAEILVRTLVADSTFFKVFDFPLLLGDPKQVLRVSNSCVISSRARDILFGDENPIGARLLFGRNTEMTVQGVYETPPPNSHMKMDVLHNLTIRPGNADWWDHWSNVAGMGYLLLREGADPDLVERKIQALAERNRFGDGLYEPYLQHLYDIHLSSGDLSYDWINDSRGDHTRVGMLTAISLLVLLIASINFINLSSARAAKRAREVGMRKVVGAEKGQLARQFLGESVLMTLFAMLLAMVAIQLLMPILPQFFGRTPTYTLMNTPLMAVIMLLVAALVGVMSGIYPALVLTAYQPAQVLKGEFSVSKRGIVLRQFLVISQFAVSIALVVAVLVIIQQLNYLRDMNMGYNRDQVLTIPLWQANGADTYELLSQELGKLSGVEVVAGTNHLPGWGMPRFEIRTEGNQNREKGLIFNIMQANEGYVPSLKISILQGRNFSPEFPSDSANSVLINETGARNLGWDDPIGRRINIVDETGQPMEREIIGVLDDFHFLSPRQTIEPLLICYPEDGFGILLLRIQSGSIHETIAQVKETLNRLYPGVTFNPNFLDDVFNLQFRGDRQFAKNIAIFAGFAILIACLGLFGLASFTTEQRRKEIAVRKVLGSSEIQLVLMLTWDFLKWVAIANLIAWPLGWFGLKRWLDDFAYRTNLTIEPFLLASVGALLIALLTISIQSIRAARNNPANTLRAET